MKALGLLLALASAAAAAEISVESVRWQHQVRGPAKPAQPLEISELSLQPKERAVGRLRAQVKLLNRGPAVEGVLLRYAVAAKISPEDGSAEPAWSVPFALDEKRVPKVAANQYLEVALDPTPLVNLYLKRLARDGFRMHELRLQIMVSPRRGDKGIRVLETTLPIKAGA